MEIFTNYSRFILEKREFIALYLIKEKIKYQEIGKKFHKSHLRMALREAESLLGENKEPQLEIVLQKLEGYFIETLRQEGYLLQLTHYAEKYLQLIDEQVNNPYKDTSLKQTFTNIFNINSEHIQDIRELRQWYLEQFLGTKNSVYNHVSNFKQEVQISIQKISTLIQQMWKEENEVFINSLRHFEQHFFALGEKANQIKEVLQNKMKTIYEIEKSVAYFQYKIETNVQIENTQLLIQAREDAAKIEQEVIDFFSDIDKQIDDITERIQYAFDRQKELMKNFQQQSRLRENLNIFLQFLLENTQIEKETWEIPAVIPLKLIPYQTPRFLFVPKKDFKLKLKNIVEEQPNDIEFIQKAKQKADKEDYVSLRVSFWLKMLKEKLTVQGVLYLHECYYEIWDEEQLWEIPSKVIDALVGFAINEAYQVNVEHKFSEGFTNQPVAIWKTTITKK